VLFIPTNLKVKLLINKNTIKIKVINLPYQCPKCGAENIKEVQDKSKVLGYAGHVPIYAKIKVCKECGNRFTD